MISSYLECPGLSAPYSQCKETIRFLLCFLSLCRSQEILLREQACQSNCWDHCLFASSFRNQYSSLMSSILKCIVSCILFETDWCLTHKSNSILYTPSWLSWLCHHKSHWVLGEYFSALGPIISASPIVMAERRILGLQWVPQSWITE